MDKLTGIKDIWLTADVSRLPKTQELVSTIKRYSRWQALKSAGVILVNLLLASIMVWVVIDYRSQMLTTRLGEACFFIAMILMITLSARSLHRISGQRDCSNGDFIRFLKEERKRQLLFYKRTQAAGLTIASGGLLLYLFEEVHKDIRLMAAVYLLTLLWIAVCWLLVRPYAMRNKTRKLEETIARLEALSQQITND